MRRMIALGVVALLASSSVTRGEAPYSEIDLTSFGEVQTWVNDGETPFEEVACHSGHPCRRFYITGMLGPSFANFGSPVIPQLDTTDSLLAAGVSVGVSLERQRGRLRLEVEGMGRDTYVGPFSFDPQFKTIVANNWSVITNVWRDFMLTERFGLYGGGGIGAGGYRLGETSDFGNQYFDPTAAFAWQAGGGLIYEVNDRLTFDVGYRYYQIDVIQQSPNVVPNQFASSEVMFGLRLFEPFRRWRQ